MRKIRFIGVSILAALLPVSFNLTAKASEPNILNLESLTTHHFLVAQSYGSITGNISTLEIEGDNSLRQGYGAAQRRDYYQAHLNFQTASNFYWQCVQDYKVQGKNFDAQRVSRKYNQALALSDRAHRSINR